MFQLQKTIRSRECTVSRHQWCGMVAGWGGGPDPLKICRRGQSMFWPTHPQNVTFIRSKLSLDNSASFTSSRLKELCQNRKVTLSFRGAWNRLMAWPDWPRPRVFYDRSTPPLVRSLPLSWRRGRCVEWTRRRRRAVSAPAAATDSWARSWRPTPARWRCSEATPPPCTAHARPLNTHSTSSWTAHPYPPFLSTPSPFPFPAKNSPSQVA